MNNYTPECPVQIFGILSLLARNPDKRNVHVRDLWVAFNWNYAGDLAEFDTALRWLIWSNWVTVTFTHIGEILTVVGLTREGLLPAMEAVKDEIEDIRDGLNFI